MTDHRTPIAKARDDFFKSDEGQGCLSPYILKDPDDIVYLRNRLERAFLAGAIAAQGIKE